MRPNFTDVMSIWDEPTDTYCISCHHQARGRVIRTPVVTKWYLKCLNLQCWRHTNPELLLEVPRKNPQYT